VSKANDLTPTPATQFIYNYLMWFVYIILCQDGSLYTGYSNNVKQRFLDHRTGKGGHYTRSHKPVRVVHQEQFATKSEALKREIEIKGWSREKKIKTLKLVLDYNSIDRNRSAN
jgi:putative endonuclease